MELEVAGTAPVGQKGNIAAIWRISGETIGVWAESEQPRVTGIELDLADACRGRAFELFQHGSGEHRVPPIGRSVDLRSIADLARTGLAQRGVKHLGLAIERSFSNVRRHDCGRGCASDSRSSFTLSPARQKW